MKKVENVSGEEAEMIWKAIYEAADGDGTISDEALDIIDGLGEEENNNNNHGVEPVRGVDVVYNDTWLAQIRDATIDLAGFTSVLKQLQQPQVQEVQQRASLPLELGRALPNPNPQVQSLSESESFTSPVTESYEELSEEEIPLRRLDYTPSIDVGIHTYNQGEYISECIESILAQTYKNFNINICIDGSTDNTLDIVKDYADRHPNINYVYQDNQGISKAINRCIEMGNGDLICAIPSDDILLPDMFETYIRYFNNNPDCKAVYARIHKIRENGDMDHGWPDRDLTCQYNLEKLKDQELYVPCPTIMWKREMKPYLGLYDPNIMCGSDWDYLLRTAYINKLDFIDKHVYKYRLHDKAEHEKKKYLARVHQDEIYMKRKLGITHKYGVTYTGVKDQTAQNIAQILHAHNLGDNIKAIIESHINVLYHVCYNERAIQIWKEVKEARPDIFIFLAWMGTDVLQLMYQYDSLFMERLDHGNLQPNPDRPRLVEELNEYVDVHLADSIHQYYELKSMGLRNVEICSDVPLHLHNIIGLPQQFTIGSYVMGGRENFFHFDMLKEMAEELTHLKFIVWGLDNVDLDHPSNMELHGWVDTKGIYRRISLLLRISHHDGYPYGFMEAGSMGRHLIHNNIKYPHVHLCRDKYEIMSTIRELSTNYQPNIEGSEYYTKLYNHDEFRRKLLNIHDRYKKPTRSEKHRIAVFSLYSMNYGVETEADVNFMKNLAGHLSEDFEVHLISGVLKNYDVEGIHFHRTNCPSTEEFLSFVQDLDHVYNFSTFVVRGRESVYNLLQKTTKPVIGIILPVIGCRLYDNAPNRSDLIEQDKYIMAHAYKTFVFSPTLSDLTPENYGVKTEYIFPIVKTRPRPVRITMNGRVHDRYLDNPDDEVKLIKEITDLIDDEFTVVFDQEPPVEFGPNVDLHYNIPNETLYNDIISKTDIFIDTSFNYADIGLLQTRLMEFAHNGVHCLVMNGKLGAETQFGRNYEFFWKDIDDLQDKLAALKHKIRPVANLNHVENLKKHIWDTLVDVPPPLRVLHVQEWPCSRNLKIARELKGSGVENYLFCEYILEYDGETEETYKEIFTEKEFQNEVTFSYRLREIVNEYKIDIIHCHNEPDHYTVRSKCTACGPVVHDVHTTTSKRLPDATALHEIEKDACQLADAVVVVNEQSIDSLESHRLMGNLIMVGNECPSDYCIDDLVLSETSSEELHVCSVGNVDRHSYRNIEEIVQFLVDSGIHVHIYWKEDPYKIDSEYYHYEGYHGPRKLISLISKHDYGLMAYQPGYVDQDCISLRSPGKLYDHLAAGLPTLTFSTMGPISSWVKKEKVGMVFRDFASLKKNVRRLYGRKYEIEPRKYSLLESVSDLLSLYHDLLDRERSN